MAEAAAAAATAAASPGHGRLRTPSTAPGVRRARRFAMGGLLAALLVAGALALIFTVGRQRQQQQQQSPHQQHAVGPGVGAADKGATVTPLDPAAEAAGAAGGAGAAGHGEHGTAAADASTSTGAGTTTTTKQQPATPSSSSSSSSTNLGLLQEALAKNPLLSNAGDPLQALAKQQHEMGDMPAGGAGMDGMEGMGGMGGGSNMTAQVVKAYLGESTCLVADIDELQDAVENGSCPVVVLTSGAKDAYMLMDMNEIVVARRVRVTGHPALLPTIDAMMGMRAFRVAEGGFLELQFVRVRQSMGMYRERYGLEGTGLGSQVLEIKGGGVMLEPGAQGADFLGVAFLMVMTDAAMVQVAIDDTAKLNGWRIYGGHVYVAGGTVRFLNCHFWDSMVLMPFTDVIAFGADVLVVAGNVFFTGCTFTTTMLLCNYASAGWNIAVLGGTMIVTFTTFQWQALAMSMAVAGMVLFTGGGVTVLTGVDYRYVSAVMNFMGFGSFATGAGALIMTGVTQEQAYAVFSSFGVGMYNALGSGVMAEQGATYVQFSGPGYMSMTGMVTFVGSGSSTHIGVPASMYGSTVTQHGQGGFSYNGAGVSVWVGCPLAMFWATYAFAGLGGVVSHGAGILVWVGNPVFMPTALAYFAGLGMVGFVGGGSAVLVGSPVAMPAALMAWSGPSMTMMTDDVMNPTSTFGMMNHTSMTMGNSSMDGMQHMMMEMPAFFWVQGTTDADGQGAAYVTGAGNVQATPLAPKWASHLLESDPAYNLWEYGQTNRSAFGGDRRSIQEAQAQALSGASLQDALALFGSDSVGNPKLLAMALDVNPGVDVSEPAVYDQFKSWVPGPILDAAKELAVLRKENPLAQALAVQRAGRDDPATLRVENTLLDYCGVCELGGDGAVEGQGLEVCDVEASCQALQAKAPPAAQALFDYDQLSFDPTSVVVADFRPTTADDGRPLDAQAFARALRGYLRANGTTGFQVTAFPTLPDPATYAFIDPETHAAQRRALASRLATADFPATHPIRAVFVTPDPAKAAALAAALEDPASSDSYADMELFVGDALASDPEAAGPGGNAVVVGALDGSLAQLLTVPAYRSADLTKFFAGEAEAAAGRNAVRLVDADHAGVPLERAVTGRPYTVKLSGFPASAKLTLQLIGQKDGKQTVASVRPLVAAGPDGAASVSWTVPSKQAPGDYYLKATDLTGTVFGLSPAFTVATTARRRLFGPSHVFYD